MVITGGATGPHTYRSDGTASLRSSARFFIVTVMFITWSMIRYETARRLWRSSDSCLHLFTFKESLDIFQFLPLRFRQRQRKPDQSKTRDQTIQPKCSESGYGLSQVEKADRNKEIKRPIHWRRERCADGFRPERKYLCIDNPWYGTHTSVEEGQKQRHRSNSDISPIEVFVVTSISIILLLITHWGVWSQSVVSSNTQTPAKPTIRIWNACIAAVIITNVRRCCTCGWRRCLEHVKRETQHRQAHDDSTERSEQQTASSSFVNLCHAQAASNKPKKRDSHCHPDRFCYISPSGIFNLNRNKANL